MSATTREQRIKGGRFTELPIYMDQVGMMVQPGLIPPPTGTW